MTPTLAVADGVPLAPSEFRDGDLETLAHSRNQTIIVICEGPPEQTIVNQTFSKEPTQSVLSASASPNNVCRTLAPTKPVTAQILAM